MRSRSTKKWGQERGAKVAIEKLIPVELERVYTENFIKRQTEGLIFSSLVPNRTKTVAITRYSDHDIIVMTNQAWMAHNAGMCLMWWQ